MWPNPKENADLDTFTEEILNGKFHFYAVFSGVFREYEIETSARNGLMPNLNI